MPTVSTVRAHWGDKHLYYEVGFPSPVSTSQQNNCKAGKVIKQGTASSGYSKAAVLRLGHTRVQQPFAQCLVIPSLEEQQSKACFPPFRVLHRFVLCWFRVCLAMQPYARYTAAFKLKANEYAILHTTDPRLTICRREARVGCLLYRAAPSCLFVVPATYCHCLSAYCDGRATFLCYNCGRYKWVQLCTFHSRIPPHQGTGKIDTAVRENGHRKSRLPGEGSLTAA